MLGVGIVGFWRIGRGVAERLAGWGVQILAYHPFVKRAMSGVTLTDLPTLLASSDIVTLHAAPSVKNRHLINGQALARMKPTAILINTGRGSLIDYAALRSALASGMIAGAALDVYEREPPSRAGHCWPPIASRRRSRSPPRLVQPDMPSIFVIERLRQYVGATRQRYFFSSLANTVWVIVGNTSSRFFCVTTIIGTRISFGGVFPSR